MQTEQILQQMHKGRELLEKLNLQSQQAMSIVHTVEFIGDHVNNKLHRHLQDHHMRELSHLIESEEIDLATQTIFTVQVGLPAAFLCKSQSPFFFFFLKACKKKSRPILVQPLEDLALSKRKDGVMKLPQPRSSSLPAPSSRLTTPTPSASISIGQTFSMAGVKPTTEPTTASAMSTKIATTATKRRHIVDLYESRRATRDPDGEQTL